MATPASLIASIFFVVLAAVNGSYGPPVQGNVPMVSRRAKENSAIDFTKDLTVTSTRREALWRSLKRVSEINQFAIMRQQCKIGGGFSYVTPPYMTIPPSIGLPSIAQSCYSCFDYTNGWFLAAVPQSVVATRWRSSL